MKIEKILASYMAGHGEKVCSVLRTRSSVKHLNEKFGRLDHSRLTPAMLRDYRAAEGLEPATINRDLGVLRAALKFATREGLIRTAPDIPKRPGEGKRTTWLPPDAIKRLIAEAGRHQGLIAFILLALTTGQRLQALLGLRWAQVDRKKNVIWFTDHELSNPKRRKGRGDVEISAGLAAVLDRLEAAANNSPYVITNSYGCRYRDINRDQWAEVTEAAGLKGLRPHDLRHTVATNLIREGVQLIHVSRLLGHANTRITEQIYVDREPKMLAPAVAALDRIAGLMP